MENTQNKKKNEIQELNEVFETFEKMIDEKYDKEIDFEETFRKNEQMKHFNRRLMECNKICIKHPEISQLLYEEQFCLNNCQRKILEVENVVAKYMNEVKVAGSISPYLNPFV